MKSLHVNRVVRWVVVSTALFAVVAFGVAPRASANGGDAPPDPTMTVMAIVSPLASPACFASGSATLLVPILGGALQEQLPLGKAVSVSDLVLTALGPVYIVCGRLPATPGTQCSLDNQIAGVWPAQIGSLDPAPVVAGNVVDSADALKRALGLPVDAATPDVMKCEIPGATEPVAAPTAPPPAPAAPIVRPAVIAPGAKGGVATAPTATVSSPSGSSPPGSSHSSSPVARFATALAHRVPGPLLALQLLAAAILAFMFAGSWVTSWRVARTNR